MDRVRANKNAAIWKTVADFTEFYKAGIPAKVLLKKIRKLNLKLQEKEV